MEHLGQRVSIAEARVLFPEIPFDCDDDSVTGLFVYELWLQDDGRLYNRVMSGVSVWNGEEWQRLPMEPSGSIFYMDIVYRA